MNKKVLGLAALTALALPVLAFAQVNANRPNIPETLPALGDSIANVVWIVFTIIAVIMFVVAGILFLTSGGSPEKVATARQAFIWGVVGIVVAAIAFVIISVVGGAL